MNDRSQIQIILHGAILLFAGLVCGVPFAVAAGHAWGEEPVRAWRVAHTGAVTIGVALLAIGGIVHRLDLGKGARRVLLFSLLVAGYTFGFGIVIAAVGGTRGLAPTAPALNVVVFLVYMAGTMATFVASSLVTAGAYTSLHRQAPE
jgi:hypothetical protein